MSKFCEVNTSSQNLGIYTFYFFYIKSKNVKKSRSKNVKKSKRNKK